jgi:glycosyltransferase involved in cell wall biosynthesis
MIENILKIGCEMTQTCQSKLYIDVTHTWTSDIQSGMQKVVRQLCHVWSSPDFECELVFFQNGSYKILPHSSFNEIVSTYSERNPKNTFRKNTHARLRPIYQKILSRVPLNLRAAVLLSPPAKKIRKFLNEIPSVEGHVLVNEQNINLLILEIIFDSDHLNHVIELVTKKKAKLTFFSYDLIPINHSQFCSPELILIFQKYLELSRLSEKLWSISNTTRHELEEYVGESLYLKKSLFKWLPPTIYAKCSHRPVVEISNVGKSYWLFVSSFEPRKNHLGLFEALRILRNQKIEIPKVVMVGANSWDNEPITKEIQNLVREGFDLNVLNNISECCLGDLYEQADLTLYPSHFEGFGLPVIESLSFGVPVVTSDIGSTGELLGLPGTLGFKQGSSHDLASKLKSFLENNQLQQNLRADAFKGKDNLGTWTQYAKELYSFSISA